MSARIGRHAVALAMLLSLGGAGFGACKKGDDTPTTCTGAAPQCFTKLDDGCCGPAIAAECGPKDAPMGTIPHWVCPGTSMQQASCVGMGAGCLGNTGTDTAIRSPHLAVPMQMNEAGALEPEFPTAAGSAVPPALASAAASASAGGGKRPAPHGPSRR